MPASYIVNFNVRRADSYVGLPNVYINIQYVTGSYLVVTTNAYGNAQVSAGIQMSSFIATLPGYQTISGQIVYNQPIDTTFIADVNILLSSTKYTLTINKTGEGYTNPAVGQTEYNAEATVNVTATAGTGWSFDHWVVDSVTNDNHNPIAIWMNMNHSLQAVFVPLDEDGGNGFIYPKFLVDGAGLIQPQYGPYYLGQTLGIKAVPNTGWVFKHFKRNGKFDSPANPTTFQNLQSGEVFVAVFERKTQILNITKSGEGTTYPVVGTHVYSWDDANTISVSATASNGYVFENWLIDGVTYDNHNPISLFMVQDHALTAIFVPLDEDGGNGGDGNGSLKKTLIIQVVGSGTTSPSGTRDYNTGQSVTVTAVAAEGWKFKKWTKDGKDAETTPITTIVMNTNHTLLATFITEGDGEKTGETNWMLIAGGAVAAIAGIGGLAYYLKRRKKK